MKLHNYTINIEWTGNEGKGTESYKSYSRNHNINGKDKYSKILASSDPAFLGDNTKYNPEDLFLSSISSCHMLWYLHLCAVNNIVVTSYIDNATGVMEESKNGSGQFTEVTLHPIVSIKNSDKSELAIALHKVANEMCFIANSCNFKIKHLSKIIVN